ncbi:MAG: hypothetical protein U0X41_09130 [Chitinophagales bacterium]
MTTHRRLCWENKIAKDQVENYAARKNMKTEEIERWLQSLLNYDV